MSDIRADIADRRTRYVEALGGEAEINAAQRDMVARAAELGALAASLRAQAISGAAIDTGELGRIESIASDALSALGIGPAPAVLEPGMTIDLAALTDEETFELEAAYLRQKEIAARVGVIPVADANARAIEEAAAMIRQLREDAAHAYGREDVARQGEAMWQRLQESAQRKCNELESENSALRAENADLRFRLDALGVSAKNNASLTDPHTGAGLSSDGPKSNVVPMPSLVVSQDLRDRYPNLAYDPTVGTW